MITRTALAFVVAILTGCAPTAPPRPNPLQAQQMLMTNQLIQQSVQPFAGGFR